MMYVTFCKFQVILTIFGIYLAIYLYWFMIYSDQIFFYQHTQIPIKHEKIEKKQHDITIKVPMILYKVYKKHGYESTNSVVYSQRASMFAERKMFCFRLVDTIFVICVLIVFVIFICLFNFTELLQNFQFQICHVFNPLSANPAKWLNTLKQLFSCCRRIV